MLTKCKIHQTSRRRHVKNALQPRHVVRLVLVVVHNYIRRCAFRARLGSRLGSDKFNKLPMRWMQVRQCTKHGHSNFTRHWFGRLPNALNSGYETCDKYLIRPCVVCLMCLGRNPNVLHICQRAWIACDCVINWRLRSELIVIRPKSLFVSFNHHSWNSWCQRNWNLTLGWNV